MDNSEYLKNLQRRFDKYNLHLRVWAEWYSSGIWLIKKPLDIPVCGNIGYESLDLPEDLIYEFTQWQKVHDICGLDWCSEMNELELDFYYGFSSKGLDLARKLKMHLKNKAYIEYEGAKYGITEISYYRVMSDWDCYLWSDDDVGLDIMCLEEDLNIKLDSNVADRLHKELEQWSKDYFDEFDWYLFSDKPCIRNVEKENEILKRGEALAQELASILPKTCVIDYNP